MAIFERWNAASSYRPDRQAPGRLAGRARSERSEESAPKLPVIAHLESQQARARSRRGDARIAHRCMNRDKVTTALENFEWIGAGGTVERCQGCFSRMREDRERDQKAI